MENTIAPPRHTNRLIDATSPYLLQHAHNPVNWHPWDEEALARARAEDKPIFLSIGYSACHWCHVMERESFESEEIAGLLNRHFVSIKVDREERPDLDEIYMAATQIYNRGGGGWPMSVFLMPDGKPFFAGTYFPPTSRYGRPGFREILTEIARLWQDHRPQLLAGAEALADAVRRVTAVESGGRMPGPDVIEQAADAYARIFDRERGGMLSGATNKFPPAMTLQLLLRQYRRAGGAGRPQAALLDVVEVTLDRMARGGIYDHLGGGICRYSTDPDWLVPHFEKMLYDQALVADAYVDAWLLTRKPSYAATARGILDFVLSDMQSPEGGFFSAFDADSEGQEGRYYVWTLDEIRRVLGESDAALFAACYGVTQDGNWHEAHGHAPPGPQNILHIPRELDVVAKEQARSEQELRRSLDSSRRRLLAVRRQRVPPSLDDKILAAWNGLMIATLARASWALDEPGYRDAAVRGAAFIVDRMMPDGRLSRVFRAGRVGGRGYLDDHAFVMEAFLNLYEATFDPRWIEYADLLAGHTLEHFGDSAGGAFFFTADDAETMIARTKDAGDGAVPGANSVHAMNLLRLAVFLDRPEWRTRAEGILAALAGRLDRSPLGMDRLLAAVDFLHGPTWEVTIVGPRSDPATGGLLAVARDRFLPNRVIAWLDPSSPEARSCEDRVRMVRGRKMIDGRPTAFVCGNGVCRPPVTRADELAGLLA